MTAAPASPARALGRHPIGVVARRTGLKPDLIRAWERRYGAIEPARSDTRRRFYSDADVERLVLLKRVVDTGHSIGQVAGAPNEELLALLREERAIAPEKLAKPTAPPSEDAILAGCLAAVERLDAPDLERRLERAAVALSRSSLIERVIAPLLQTIGELWQQGSLRPAHEHLASAVVRSFLGDLLGASPPGALDPIVVVTTPARQRHELGALIVAAVAAGEGWNAAFLGADLPPEEIAAAAHQSGARLVALSVTFPPDDPRLADDFKRLRRMLDPGVAVAVGGRAAASYTDVLDEIGALRSTDLAQFRRHLADLRQAPHQPSA